MTLTYFEMEVGILKNNGIFVQDLKLEKKFATVHWGASIVSLIWLRTTASLSHRASIFKYNAMNMM